MNIITLTLPYYLNADNSFGANGIGKVAKTNGVEGELY